MDQPTITARVTFIPPEEGGRSRPAHDSRTYRPHLVIGDPGQRDATDAHVAGHRLGAETYLGVQFTGDDRLLAFGRPEMVVLRLMYHPEVDYSALVEGATFTIREGGRVVGWGEVMERLPGGQ